MAVFTKITQQQLSEFLASFFPEFAVVRFAGIEGGIENSNYFLDLQLQGVLTHWVLTVVEMDNAGDLLAINKLTQYLAGNSLPVPAPVNNQCGLAVQRLAGKPGLLVPRMPGSHTYIPNAGECQQIGSFLGQMHSLTLSLPAQVALGRDLHWLENCQHTLMAQNVASLSQDECDLLRNEISEASKLGSAFASCPKGWTHGDLFVDNALFHSGRLSGVIDFYHACEDYFIIDLAIACNDWCYRLDHGYDTGLMHALLAGYRQQRPLLATECELWPRALCLGALRFWLSRLLSKHTKTYQSNARRGQPFKNPQEMKQKLLAAQKIGPLR